MRTNRCEACRWWQELDYLAEEPARRWGLCRRWPPVREEMDADNGQMTGVWSSTWNDDWCGEFQALDA